MSLSHSSVGQQSMDSSWSVPEMSWGSWAEEPSQGAWAAGLIRPPLYVLVLMKTHCISGEKKKWKKICVAISLVIPCAFCPRQKAQLDLPGNMFLCRTEYDEAAVKAGASAGMTNAKISSLLSPLLSALIEGVCGSCLSPWFIGFRQAAVGAVSELAEMSGALLMCGSCSNGSRCLCYRQDAVLTVSMQPLRGTTVLSR